MKGLNPFSYYEPREIQEGVRILAESGADAFPLAGGTDLLVRMKRRELSPSVLVNLKKIPGLDFIQRNSGNGVSIGALTTISAIEHSPFLRQPYAALFDAARVLGSLSIRNLATIGGNIGRASPASDLAPPLLAMGARLLLRGPKGERAVGMEEIFAGPGKTILLQGELLVSFLFPETAPESRSAYEKIGRRESVDCALASVAIFLKPEGGPERAASLRIALGAVSPTPMRAKKAEAFLLSGPLTTNRIREASWIAGQETAPISDLRCSASYRKEMAAVLVQRTLLRLVGSSQRKV